MNMKYFIGMSASILLFIGVNTLAQQSPPASAPPATAVPAPAVGNVNKKLNLEDITVKGELLSDDRMNFVRRQREELKNRIKFRTNFRPEILQEYLK